MKHLKLFEEFKNSDILNKLDKISPEKLDELATDIYNIVNNVDLEQGMLYHGTSVKYAKDIIVNGFKRINGSYVNVTSEFDEAEEYTHYYEDDEETTVLLCRLKKGAKSVKTAGIEACSFMPKYVVVDASEYFKFHDCKEFIIQNYENYMDSRINRAISLSNNNILKEGLISFKDSLIQKTAVVYDSDIYAFDEILQMFDDKKYKTTEKAKVDAWIEHADDGDVINELEARIDDIKIAKNMRGYGLGKKIVDDIKIWAMKNCAKRIVLESTRNAMGFWKRMGFDIYDQGSSISTSYFKLSKSMPEAIVTSYLDAKENGDNPEFVETFEKIMNLNGVH